MSRAARFILNLFVYLAIIGGLIFGLPRFLTWALETPYPMAAITSGSMWPVLNEGDLVFIQGGRKLEELKVGDIIVWRGTEDRGFTIHRVARINGSQIITKGDANFNEDQPIEFDQVVGRALTFRDRPVHIPHLGSITVLASNWKK
ncbi:MAG: signal peptidase I [Candidatus Vogelbacteria bacterium]|nr:signal peptidase I [Candidatus Vogelbacteria bacterium]